MSNGPHHVIALLANALLNRYLLFDAAAFVATFGAAWLGGKGRWYMAGLLAVAGCGLLWVGLWGAIFWTPQLFLEGR